MDAVSHRVRRRCRQPGSPVIERAGADDLMELAADAAGSPMQVGVILVLAAGGAPDLDGVRSTIAERIRTVPRLRQRLVRTPLGCGRPVWLDDPGVDIRRHVRAVRCPAPGDETALLAIAAEAIADPLPWSRPPWSATLVTGLARGEAALIVVFHHVLADGINGLAMLAHLVDGVPAVPVADFPRRPPHRRELLADALRSRARAIARLPDGLRGLRAAIAELAPGTVPRPPRCSLNLPTGRRRALTVARADLALVRAAAHAQGGTVNDVVLTAVTGALHTLLRHRGEHVEQVVVSVPISRHREGDGPGNQVGVLPVALPVTGDAWWRLAEIARITRVRKTAAPGSSAALLAPMIRLLASLRLLGRFTSRQRLVTTFVTNLRGPAERLSFMGAKVIDVIPMSTTTGNVTVAFAALSYAGTLVIDIIADPGRCPDLPALAQALHDQLDTLTGGSAQGPTA